jgi:tetraprenyl-beta-curcumene synthase
MVSREVDRWRARAQSIPEATLREDALDSIVRKRGHADGAALFWILPRGRHQGLLALLVAYQTIWDFLDNVSERGAHVGHCNGELLHRALVEALDPCGPSSAYYSHHSHRDDGGYLPALVHAARERCSELPAYEHVRPLVLDEAARCAIQSLNHEPDSESRDAALRAWAAGDRQSSEWRELHWFESAAAASASLVPHVLLALAADRGCDSLEAARTRAAYMPWASLVTAMLDSYCDRSQDAASGDHSYVGHYQEEEVPKRLGEIIARASSEVGCLRHGHRHTIILASVVALYLSKDSTRASAERAASMELVRRGGSLSRLLLPVLRAWRVAHGQRAA